MPISKSGRTLTSLEEWQTYAPPKSPHHWVEGRSAKEVARAWLSPDGNVLPTEVSAILNSHSEFGQVHSWNAEPEAKLPFDSFPGEPRNSDLAVYAIDATGSYVLAIEAKADEPFGETVSQALANALERSIENPRSNGIARAQLLGTSLLPPRSKGSPHVGDLRYQLLTACAGAVEEAKRKGCFRAVMLVHEFVTTATNDANHARNAIDLSAFVHRLSSGAVTEVKPSQLYGPYYTPGSPEVKFFVGKVIRQLRPGGVKPHAQADVPQAGRRLA